MAKLQPKAEREAVGKKFAQALLDGRIADAFDMFLANPGSELEMREHGSDRMLQMFEQTPTRKYVDTNGKEL